MRDVGSFRVRSVTQSPRRRHFYLETVGVTGVKPLLGLVGCGSVTQGAPEDRRPGALELNPCGVGVRCATGRRA
jgi:hypothetical protein